MSALHHDGPDSDGPDGTPVTPFASAAHRYLRAGWRGVLPLPSGRKYPPPDGYTGEVGAWTSGADLQAWIDGGLDGTGARPAGNIALRLPPNIIGLDVDAYDGKAGTATLAQHLVRLGPLPDTWTSTSRANPDGTGDHASGIRLYRLPTGVSSAGWPGQLGPGVETIRTGHRYMVVAPSLHPDGGTYRWTRPDGHGGTVPTLEIPTPDDLPELPTAWVEHLQAQAHDVAGKADLAATEALDWLRARQAHTQPHTGPCRLVAGYLRHKTPALTGAGGGSRHDAMLAATARLAHAAAEGHAGVIPALQEVRATFEHATAGEHRDSTGEWQRALLGAVQIAAHHHATHGPRDPITVDPCDNPLAGLTIQESPWTTSSSTSASSSKAASASSTPSTSAPSASASTPPSAPAPASTPSSATSLSASTSSSTASPSVAEADGQVGTLTPDEDRAAAYDTAVAQEVVRLRLRRDAQRRLAAEDAAADPPPPFDAGTLGAILARPPEPPMRADGLVPSEASTLLVAKRKAGKTTWLLNYARALLTGTNFLGRFPVRPVTGRVAFLNFEVSARQLARWADEHGIDHERLLVVNLRGRRNPLAHTDDRAALAQLLSDHDVEAVIVDPFGRAYAGQSQNDAGEVGQWLVSLDTFVRSEAGATDLILAVHAGWNGDRTRGSSALEDWADVIVNLTREEDDDGDSPSYMKAIGRDIDVDEDALNFDHGTRTLTMAGTGGRKQSKTIKRQAALARELVDLVERHPGSSVTALERLCKDAGVTVAAKGDVGRALTFLASSGQVRCDDKGPGKPKLYHPKTAPPRTPPKAPEAGDSTTPPTPSIRRGGGDGGVDTTTTTPPPERDRNVHRLPDGTLVDADTGELIE